MVLKRHCCFLNYEYTVKPKYNNNSDEHNNTV